jgi:SAM-dependent methyltransferase
MGQAAAGNMPEELRWENAPCPMGCPRRDIPVAIGQDRIHRLEGRFQVVRCGNCGLLRTNPRPTLDSIGAYYPDSYPPFQEQAAAPLPLWRKLLRGLKWDNLSNAIPPIPPGSLLEVGCATGAFLRLMRDRGWEVRGIEFSPGAGRRAQDAGFPVHIGSVESAPEPERRYDLIVAWHTLEHLHRPLEALQCLHRWTKPGGWLACSLPDAGGLQFRIFQESWCDLDVPRHLYHFTPQTLAVLLAASGWKMDSAFYHRDLSNLLLSLGNRAEDTFGQNHWLSRALRAYTGSRSPLRNLELPFATVLAWMHQTGRITVWARREE